MITNDTKLSDIVLHDPSVVTVYNRFGIRLGVGDLTVAKVCQEKGLDTEFFLTILNTYIYDDYFPERIPASVSAATIVDYLSQTNAYYAQGQIPNIERHFSFLISRSPSENSNLGLMMKFFQEVKQQLLNRIDDDSRRWFPEVLAAEASAKIPQEIAINHADSTEDSVEDKLDDLINMFVIHLKGDYDADLARAVLLALVRLKKDIVQNNRIRERILRPFYHILNNKQS